MNIVVCIKQVPDTETQVKLDSSGALDLSTVKWILNPYDEFAIEEALLVKQHAFPQATITAITLGPQKAQDILRTAMAMGCDNALHIQIDEPKTWLTPLSIGIALGHALKKLEPQIIFCGKQGIDHDNLIVPYAIAETLGAACVNVVQKATYTPQSMALIRESDGGTKEHYTCPLPVVVGVTKGINKPRYPSLPGIMKAKKQPIESLTLDSVLTPAETHWITPHSYELPKERSSCKMIPGTIDQQVDELVRVIREEIKIL